MYSEMYFLNSLYTLHIYLLHYLVLILYIFSFKHYYIPFLIFLWILN